MPQRIQRSRAAGWRKPDGVIDVTRPGKWGNPITEQQTAMDYPALPIARVTALTVTSFQTLAARDGKPWRRRIFTPGVGWRARSFRYPPLATIRAELGGHDLMCWCALDSPCHADVLLTLANPTGDTP